MFVGCRLWLIFQSPGLVIVNQALKVIAVRPVAAESILIEQALDAASGTDLVGNAL